MTLRQRKAAFLLLLAGFIAAPQSSRDPAENASPVLVIFDTDIGSDIDDTWGSASYCVARNWTSSSSPPTAGA